MSRYEEVASMFTFGIAGNPIASAARQWICDRELAMDENVTYEASERDAYDMNEAEVVAYLDLVYPGGSEAFIGDHAE